MNRRRNIRVERLEDRNTPSGTLATGTTLAASALIRGYSDPNEFRSMAVPAVQNAAVSACPADPARR